MIRSICLISLTALGLSIPGATKADICELADSGVAKVTGGAAAATVVTGGALKTLGLATVLHSSGAAIATGTGGYVAGTLGTLGVSTLGVVTAPATLAVAGATVTAVGGTLLYCRYFAEPDDAESPKTEASVVAKAPPKKPAQKADSKPAAR